LRLLKRICVLLGLSLAGVLCHSASIKNVVGSQQARDSATNQNFENINRELTNCVHKTSTETIHGYKYFIDPVDFGTITADVGTITSLSAPTLSATTLAVTSITLNGLSYAGNPVGTIVMYISSTVTPSGWLYCDGSSKSTTTYSRLFAVIGYTFGGSGANFSLPDFRGVFPKGQGTTDRALGKDASGNFYAATMGAYATDQLQGHWHNLFSNNGTALTTRLNAAGGANGISPTEQGSGGSANVSEARDLKADGTNGTPRTGHTTEPQSIGINFIIYTGV
jgi:Microcystin-dependent protein